MKLLSFVFTLVVFVPCSVRAEMRIDIIFATSEDKPGDQKIIRVPAVTLAVFDGEDEVKKCIDTARSGAVSALSWSLQQTIDGEVRTFGITELHTQPRLGPYATEIVGKLDGEVSGADLDKEGWRVIINGTDANPALTLKKPSGEISKVARVEQAMAKIHKGDLALIDEFQPKEKKFDVGGGEDGALFGLSFSYRSPATIVKENDIRAFHAQFDGSFTPDPEKALSLYGRFEGEAGYFRSVEVGPTDFINGSVLFDVNTRFEGDQKLDNYNYTLGAGVWGILGLKPVSQLSQAIFWIANLGQQKLDRRPPVLTLFAGYDYVAASEHDATAAEQSENRARFMIRYRTALWHDVDLPVMPTVFNVDAVADYNAVWDFAQSSVLSEWKATLEFIPKSINDDKLAFTVSYVSGKISPTFVDEDAFLAGLRWKF